MFLGCEVIVLCGEFVEIGGLFCIFLIFEIVGMCFWEVGMMNCMCIGDYVVVVSEEMGVLLKVYFSNYKILGFVEGVLLEEFVVFGCECDVLVFIDEGSGFLCCSDCL